MTTTATFTSQGVRVTCVQSFDALDDLRNAWNRLAGDVPFRRFEWCEAWWRHYATPGSKLLVLLVWDADEVLIGVAPWYLEATMRHGRVIRFLGSGEVCADYGSLLAVPGLERTVSQKIASWLCCEGAWSWDLLLLEGVAKDDSSCGWLFECMRARHHQVVRRHLANSWRIRLPAAWETFVAGLSKPRRRKVRTLEQQVFATGRARRCLVEREEQLEQGLRVLHDLHQRRRTSIGDAGCFASPRFAAFHAQVAAEFFRNNLLRLSWIELDGKPVAVEYGYVAGDTVYAYQSGFDPEAAHEHPGWLQLIASLHSAFDGGCRYFDFLRGDEPYKASWQAEPVPLTEIRIVGRHLSARLRHTAWTAARAARNVVRSGLRRFRGKTHAETGTAAGGQAAQD